MNERKNARSSKPTPLPVVVQPDPMLQPRGSGVRTIIAGLASAFIVIVVLYGLTRPKEPQVMASAPQAGQSAGQGAGSAAPPQNSQQQPSTTGSGGQQSQNANQQNQKTNQPPAQPGSSQAPPGQNTPKNGQATTGEKRSDSATTGKATAAPSDKSQPKQ